MGIFGWSYPPGCSGPPDGDDEFCLVCGKSADDCECPECLHPVDCGDGNTRPCGLQGCLEHLGDHGLVLLIHRLEDRVHGLRQEASKREKKTDPCPKCGTVHTITIFTDYELYCCGLEWWQNRWFDASADLLP